MKRAQWLPHEWCPCFPLAGAAAAGEGMGWSVPPSQHPAARPLSALQDSSLFSVSPFRKNSVVTLVPGVVSKIGNRKNICWVVNSEEGWHLVAPGYGTWAQIVYKLVSKGKLVLANHLFACETLFTILY